MTLPIRALFDITESHALSSGYFETVNGHEPKKAPASGGLAAAVWVQSIGPVQSSGLTATTGRVELRVRLYSSMIQEPQDAIDPELVDALDYLMAAYSGDFSFGGLIRQVDLLGAYGTGLSAQAAYLNQDNCLFRVFDITLPLIVNDLWSQSP